MGRKNGIRRSGECARAWSEAGWRPLVPSTRTWLHATLPGILPAAIAVSSVMTHVVTKASAHLPPGHGA